MFTISLVRFSKFAVVASLLLSFPCFAATGAGSGGGGDPRCQNFYDLAFEISTDMVQLGQSEFGNTNLIDVGLIRSIVMKPLPVTPGLNLPRPAWSDKDLLTTQLDVDQWESHMTQAEKIRLVIHELMVLSGKEVDGVYNVSKIAANVLIDHGYFAVLKFEKICEESDKGCVMNDDGSLTIQIPLFRGSFYSSDEHTSLDGVCKSFGAGFTTAIGHQSDSLTNSISHSASATKAVLFDSSGHYAGVDEKECYDEVIRAKRKHYQDDSIYTIFKRGRLVKVQTCTTQYITVLTCH